MIEHATPQHDASHGAFSKTIFGFWLYLMTDCLLFATLFAAYAVLQNNTFGGPPASELFSLQSALAQTLVLLTSSFTSGLAQVAALREDKARVITWIVVTFLLGVVFFSMVMTDFTRLVEGGNSWQRSAFLSAYFTLVGTQVMHIAFGLLWMLVLVILVWQRGLITSTLRRLTCLRLFWHFLNIVWLLIFTIVYLMGAKS